MYPQQAQPAPPRRRSRKPSAAVAAVFALIGAVALAAIVVLLLRGPTGTDTPTTPAPSDAVPAVDMGAGTPGAACATNRLGKTFTKDGVVYTCKGPKPYSWQP